MTDLPFHVAADQIIGPNGQAFKAQGIDVLESTLGSVVGDASGGALLKSFPATNMVRIAMESGYNSYNSPAFVNAVNWLTAKGIVVEIGNYNTTGGVATGQGLVDEVNWFAALASKYKSNPYVWFSTDNEPTDGNAFNGATTAEQLAAYNAIRGTGNTSMIGIEDTFATLNPGNYAGMTNIHWDSHYYNWNAGYSADVATNEAAINNRNALLNSLFKSADGAIPIITGEFGDSTSGAYIDAGGAAAVQAVVDLGPSHSGWASWIYYWPGNYSYGMTGDELTNQNTGQLTPYGQQIAGAMTAAYAPGGGGGIVTPPANPLPPATLVSTGSGSDALVLGISEDAYQGDAQFTVSIDGKQQGGTFTATASHAAGASQSFTFNGDWAIGAHTVVVAFLNDAWDGTAATDRNLYVNAVSYDGTATGQSADLFNTGAENFSVTDSTAIPVSPPPVTPPVIYPDGIPVVDSTTPSATSPGSATVPPSGAPESYPVAAFDTTTSQPVDAVCQAYAGPVAGVQNEYINITSDSLNITAATPNCFIHTGSGNDAIAVSSGINVLDGGTGSNFLTGGSGADTFFVDDRAAPADIWSTVNSFDPGDAATIWGVTPQDFNLSWVDGQGAAGYTGLTLHATASGRPTASLTLAGYSQADLTSGRLSVQFGTDPANGSAYMYVQGNC